MKSSTLVSAIRYPDVTSISALGGDGPDDVVPSTLDFSVRCVRTAQPASPTKLVMQVDTAEN